MGLQIIGAGLGRTGTTSLKLALEELLAGRCYHMIEVRERPEDPDAWGDAYEGRSPDWTTFFDGYVATVDWPAAPFWWELAQAFPDAPILLSSPRPRCMVAQRVQHHLHRTRNLLRARRTERRLDPHGPGHDERIYSRLAG